MPIAVSSTDAEATFARLTFSHLTDYARLRALRAFHAARAAIVADPDCLPWMDDEQLDHAASRTMDAVLDQYEPVCPEFVP